MKRNLLRLLVLVCLLGCLTAVLTVGALGDNQQLYAQFGQLNQDGNFEGNAGPSGPNYDDALNLNAFESRYVQFYTKNGENYVLIPANTEFGTLDGFTAVCKTDANDASYWEITTTKEINGNDALTYTVGGATYVMSVWGTNCGFSTSSSERTAQTAVTDGYKYSADPANDKLYLILPDYSAEPGTVNNIVVEIKRENQADPAPNYSVSYAYSAQNTPTYATITLPEDRTQDIEIRLSVTMTRHIEERDEEQTSEYCVFLQTSYTRQEGGEAKIQCGTWDSEQKTFTPQGEKETSCTLLSTAEEAEAVIVKFYDNSGNLLIPDQVTFSKDERSNTGDPTVQIEALDKINGVWKIATEKNSQLGFGPTNIRVVDSATKTVTNYNLYTKVVESKGSGDPDPGPQDHPDGGDWRCEGDPDGSNYYYDEDEKLTIGFYADEPVSAYQGHYQIYCRCLGGQPLQFASSETCWTPQILRTFSVAFSRTVTVDGVEYYEEFDGTEDYEIKNLRWVDENGQPLDSQNPDTCAGFQISESPNVMTFGGVSIERYYFRFLADGNAVPGTYRLSAEVWTKGENSELLDTIWLDFEIKEYKILECPAGSCQSLEAIQQWIENNQNADADVLLIKLNPGQEYVGDLVINSNIPVTLTGNDTETYWAAEGSNPRRATIKGTVQVKGTAEQSYIQGINFVAEHYNEQTGNYVGGTIGAQGSAPCRYSFCSFTGYETAVQVYSASDAAEGSVCQQNAVNCAFRHNKCAYLVDRTADDCTGLLDYNIVASNIFENNEIGVRFARLGTITQAVKLWQVMLSQFADNEIDISYDEGGTYHILCQQCYFKSNSPVLSGTLIDLGPGYRTAFMDEFCHYPQDEEMPPLYAPENADMTILDTDSQIHYDDASDITGTVTGKDSTELNDTGTDYKTTFALDFTSNA